jgi:hypothetical protein
MLLSLTRHIDKLSFQRCVSLFGMVHCMAAHALLLLLLLSLLLLLLPLRSMHAVHIREPPYSSYSLHGC